MQVEAESRLLSREVDPVAALRDVCLPLLLVSSGSSSLATSASSSSSSSGVAGAGAGLDEGVDRASGVGKGSGDGKILKVEESSIGEKNGKVGGIIGNSNNGSGEGEGAEEGSGNEQWEKEFVCVETLRRLAVHDPGVFLTGRSKEESCDLIAAILQFLCVQSNSLRSAQARNALHAIEDIFSSSDNVIGKVFSETGIQAQIMGGLLGMLLVRSTNEKKFLRDLAARAMKAIAKALYSLSGFLEILSSLELTNGNAKANSVLIQGMQIAIQCRIADIASATTKGAATASSKEAASNRTERESNFKKELISTPIILECLADLVSGKNIEARKPAQQCATQIREFLGDETFIQLAQTALLSKLGEGDDTPKGARLGSNKSVELKTFLDLTVPGSTKENQSNRERRSIKELRAATASTGSVSPPFTTKSPSVASTSALKPINKTA